MIDNKAVEPGRNQANSYNLNHKSVLKYSFRFLWVVSSTITHQKVIKHLFITSCSLHASSHKILIFEDQTLTRHSHTQLPSLILDLSLKMKLLLHQTLQPHIQNNINYILFLWRNKVMCIKKELIHTHTQTRVQKKNIYTRIQKTHKKCVNKQKSRQQNNSKGFWEIQHISRHMFLFMFSDIAGMAWRIDTSHRQQQKQVEIHRWCVALALARKGSQEAYFQTETEKDIYFHTWTHKTTQVALDASVNLLYICVWFCCFCKRM